jgi:hypothetical protein
MDEHGRESKADSQPRVFGSAKGLIHMADDFDSALLSEPALSDWNREEEDAAWAHLQQPDEGAVTPMLEQAIRAAKTLSEQGQDALAAAMLECVEDERRWAESFARTHEALAELAREALAEHHAGQTLDAAEWLDASPADTTDEADERGRRTEE